MILPRADHVSRCKLPEAKIQLVCAFPAHPLARRLLETFAGGVAAPSANRFGKLSPTTAEAVREGLEDDVDMILDGGQCQVGIESTILSLCGDEPAILRPGMIDRDSIATVLGVAVIEHHSGGPEGHRPAGDRKVIRVPGALESHYSPRTPMAVSAAEDLIELFAEGMAIGRSQGVIAALLPAVESMKTNFGDGFYSAFPCEAFIVAPEDAAGYAHMLYDALRKLDQLSLHKILVEAVPTGTAWAGVRDRLARASGQK